MDSNVSTKARKIIHAFCSTQKYLKLQKNLFTLLKYGVPWSLCNGATKKVHFVHQRNHNQSRISLDWVLWVGHYFVCLLVLIGERNGWFKQSVDMVSPETESFQDPLEHTWAALECVSGREWGELLDANWGWVILPMNIGVVVDQGRRSWCSITEKNSKLEYYVPVVWRISP